MQREERKKEIEKRKIEGMGGGGVGGLLGGAVCGVWGDK